MPRLPRKLVFDRTQVGVYHCMNRCVRRAFLCGNDAVSGKSYEHRKQWLQDRLEFLAPRFAVDILGFSVMGNHVHVIVRNRPDLVPGWSDDEVARRWCGLFSKRRHKSGQPPAPPAPTEAEVQKIKGDPERLAEVRRRLADLSWFMRCVAEPIACAANAEDDCPGRFWQGRFRCVPLLDEAALAACMAYVDLNPVRARLAESPATSPFTSVFERLHAELQESNWPASVAARRGVPLHDDKQKRLRRRASAPVRLASSRSDAAHATPGVPSQPTRAAWLSPFELSEQCAPGAPVTPVPPSRASNLGCLPMRFAAYVELLNWTVRQLLAGKPSTTPSEPAPIPKQLSVTGEGWLRLVKDFGRLFRRAAGTPDSLRRHTEKLGGHRTTGITHSRAIFV
jgi:hypothetical protein